MNTHLKRTPLFRAITAVMASAVIGAGMVSATSAQSSPAAGCLSWADGSHVVFCQKGTDGSTELYERARDGVDRQLTHIGATVGSVDVSPDGGLITFHATFPGSAEPQVYVVPRLGSRTRTVAAGSAIVHLEPTTVMVGGAAVEVPGAQVQRLTPVGSNIEPRFTPDGSRIGFVSDRLGVASLWSMRIDGSDQRELLLAVAD